MCHIMNWYIVFIVLVLIFVSFFGKSYVGSVCLSCDNSPFPQQTCHGMKRTVVADDSFVLCKSDSEPTSMMSGP